MTSNVYCILAWFIILAGSATVISGIIQVSVGLFLHRKTKKEFAKLTRYGINVGLTIDESIPQLLEGIINECFMEYKAMNLAYRGDGYIDNEEEIKIRTDLVSMVTNQLSPAALDKLSTYYNMACFAEIIGRKIYIIVTAYVVEQNKIPIQ